ncbi:rhomboid domain-containing protein 3 [Lithobates pipiens]
MLRLVLGTFPALGCCLLMLLIVFGNLMLSCTDLELHLETLQEIWDGHRLLTHGLCSINTQLMIISLLLFLLLHWQLENRIGTLYFLYLSCMCTFFSATIYILISTLLPLPAAPASGYLATNLSLLIAHSPAVPWRWGKKMLPLLCCGITITVQYWWPQSSFLYHICGMISGLAIRKGILRYLEPSETRIRALDRIFSCLKSIPIARFIPSRQEGSGLHITNFGAQDRLPFTYTDVQEPNMFADMSLDGAAAQTASLGHFQDTPVWFGREETLEEAMLKAGILASLREYEQQETQRHELTLNKSSVSALRLQQLERMGFPTGPAVVALAATGKVEGAVSLLVEGQVGEDIAVTTERQTGSGLQNSSRQLNL